MASNNFKTLRLRSPITDKRASHTADLTTEKSKKLLDSSLIIQTDIKEQFKTIKKDYKKNKNIYDSLHNEVVLLRKKREGPKFRKGLNFFDKLKGPGAGGGGGLLSTLMSAFGLSGFLLKPFRAMFSKGITSIMKGVRGALNSLLRGMGNTGKKAIQALGRGALSAVNKLKNSNVARGALNATKTGFRKVISAGARMMGPQGLGRAAVRQVAGLIGRGAVVGAAGAAGYPLLIAAAAASVGYGSYKLGRYLKLSDKLDDFIKRVSSGKYTNLVDFILGIANGTVGKELYGWVQAKISTMFTDSLKFLKDKASELLGKFSPFASESDVREDPSGDKSVIGGQQAEQLNANKSSGTIDELDESSTKESGSLWDRLKSSAGSAVQSVKEFVTGDNASGEHSGNPDIQYSSNLAWHAITGGKNTQLNHAFRTKSRPGHDGIDIDAKEGTPIYALEDGVFSSGWHVDGGNQAFVRETASGYSYGHAHLKTVIAKNGRIKAGDVIGLSGNTGRTSTGPHIHFSVRKNGKIVDPLTVKTVINKPKSAVGANQGDMSWPSSMTSSSEKSFAPTSNIQINSGKSILKALGKKSILKKIKNVVRGKDDDYIGLAKSLADIIFKLKNEESTEQGPVQQQPQQKMQPTIQESPQPQPSSKAGSISGKEGDVKDPRGALNSQIMMACYSPLFI